MVWSDSVNLSSTPEYSGHPAIVADDYGLVHVFWSEDVGGTPFRMSSPDDNTPAGNSILYTQWDGLSWTPPVDILFVPGELIAEYVAAAVDAENRIHVVWTAQSDFYYSNALSWEAESAHAWSKPLIVATDSARSQNESDVVADSQGNIHIVYATRGNGAGAYHIRSDDGGLTWQSATQLSESFDMLERSFSNAMIVTDGGGRLHVVWQTNQEKGYGQAVYHAYSEDMGASWSAPVQLGYRGPEDTWVEWPYIMSRGESELHLIYTNGSNQGRAHRVSADGGKTWPPPVNILPEMEGINGYVVPATDGSGQVHLAVNMRTRAEQVGGIYYAYWLGSSWSPVVAVDAGTEASASAHYAAVAVRLGNELHVVWTAIDRGEIWHTRGLVSSVGPNPPRLVPSRQSLAPTPSPSVAADNSRQTQESISQTESFAPGSSDPVSGFSALGSPMALGIGAPLLLIMSVLLWTRLRALRH